MKLKNVPVTKLKPADWNPRHMPKSEMENLTKSLKEFGYIEPIVWNEQTGNIVGGHQRFYSLTKDNHVKELECVVVKLSPNKEKKLNLALNRIHGEWDWKKLRQVVTDIELDLDLTGFNKDELSFRFKDLFPVEELPIKEQKSIVNSKRGEVYELGEHRLMCGDATDPDDVAKLMDGKKAQMIFTDPPYNVDYAGTTKMRKNPQFKHRDIIGDNVSDEEYKIFLTKMIAIFKQYSEYQAWYIWFSIKHLPVLYETLKKEKVYYSGIPIIWDKQNYMLSWTRKYSAIYEPVVYCGNDTKDQTAEPVKYLPFVEGQDGYYPEYAPCIFCGKGASPIKNPRWFGPKNEVAVWRVDKDKSTQYLHPTQKPVELSERAIRNSSKEGEIVLDFYGGAGGTLIGAEHTGRICYMMELDPIYCDVIKDRYLQYMEETHD